MKANTLYAVAVAIITSAAPVAQAAVPKGFGPSTVDVLINRPGSNGEMIILAKTPSVASLIKLNMKIYGCVGWQIGRYEYIRKYNIDIGHGPCRIRG